jgi:hypothetical protein
MSPPEEKVGREDRGKGLEEITIQPSRTSKFSCQDDGKTGSDTAVKGIARRHIMPRMQCGSNCVGSTSGKIKTYLPQECRNWNGAELNILNYLP